MKLVVNCEYACFGRTISNIVKTTNKTNSKINELLLYNIDMLIFKGNLKHYLTKYRNKLAKKSHVKSRMRTKPKVTKSIESIIKYNFRKMGLSKKIKIKLSHEDAVIESDCKNLDIAKTKLPFKGFSIKTLIDKL
jgi:hypothetical protein